MATLDDKTKITLGFAGTLVAVVVVAVSAWNQIGTNSAAIAKQDIEQRAATVALKVEIETLKTKREADNEGWNELRRQFTGMNVKLDLLLQRSEVRQSRGGRQ